MSTAPPPAKVHKRAYQTADCKQWQACIPCRERRVKCDLGSVDAPHEGPCGRCRRERKQCTFSATRGKKKAAAIAAGRAVTPGATSTPSVASHISSSANIRNSSERVLSPAASVDLDSHGHVKIPPNLAGRPFSSTTQSAGDKTASTLLRDVALTTHDALNLLWEAGRHGERARADEAELSRSAAPSVAALKTPELMVQEHQSISHEEALRVWSKLRFVRSGLFTAKEGLEMVHYFHTHLAPFSPISSSPFQDPATHETLLEEEPILAATILVLASRYMKFSGRGAVSRGYLVHEQLWRYLQDMISRMIFGQEQFKATGGEASTSQLHDAGSSAHLGGLRTLGTCEALLLLSEWHPRALHVPAFEDGDSLLVSDDTRRTKVSTAVGRIQIDWLEPAWRSDRMCWSMLGNALSLAVELGVFDEYDSTTLGAREARKDIWSSEVLRQRAYRVQNLLWVYLTQTSGRLGWKNLTSVSLMENEGSRNHGDTIRCWVTVASLMKRGNEFLFQSREKTRDIIRSGEYLKVLEMLNPLLSDWQRDFERAKLSHPMRCILSIEYSYVRVYVNSVALQAVVEHKDRTSDPNHPMPVSTMLNPYEDNKEYFMLVVVAAREILLTVVNELVPNDSLKHVPIRTYSRIVAGAMFCLKSAALSTNEEENAISLNLVERAAHALCTCVVDDVHLSNRFGELLHALVLTIRSESSTAKPHQMAAPTAAPSAHNAHTAHNGVSGVDGHISNIEAPFARAPIGHPEHFPNVPPPTPATGNITAQASLPPDLRRLQTRTFQNDSTRHIQSLPRFADTSSLNTSGSTAVPLSSANMAGAASSLEQPLPVTLNQGDAGAGAGYAAPLYTRPSATAPTATTGPETAPGASYDHTVQHDPLMNFAGVGATQIGWSGGQDFFDLLGPLLDVQYDYT